MAHFLVSAAHKSSGKTTLSIGLASALSSRGLIVQPFKKGPDYIDPMWLGAAAGRACHNLDFHTMDPVEIRDTFVERSQGADLSLIEGNKGLYDGLDLEGSNSNAALARLVQAPVILVLDARGMTRGIAPLLLGYQAFDPQVRIAGVILNKVGGNRHEAKLRQIIDHYTDIPVLGAVQRSAGLEIDERHLGLVPSNESTRVAERIRHIGAAVAEQVDLDALLAIARSAPPLPARVAPAVIPFPGSPVRVAVARDSAFGFYYPGDLEALEAAGAELVFFNTLRDERLPRADALFIGGGFPETHMQELASNRSLQQEIRRALEGGMPAYAECGGLMYLCRSIRWNGQSAPMVGIVQADAVMYDRPQGRGYTRLEETADALWPGDAGIIDAHEFHYSALEGLPEDSRFAYRVRRGTGIDGRHDGLIYRNLQANYAHLRDVRRNHWARRFVEFARRNSPHRSQAPALGQR